MDGSTVFKTISKFLSVSIIAASIAACGGGGGGGGYGPPTPPPTTGWQPGVFLDESTYALRCETPGNSINIYANGCPAVTDFQGTVLDENNYLRSWSNRTYLWYDEIVDRDPGLYADPIEYYGLLKTTALSPTGAPKDKFHFAQDSLSMCQLSQGGVSAGYGATWSIIAASPPRQIIVAYTEPNTPATANGILRGAEILEVDGVAVVDGDADALNAGLFPSNLGESHTFSVLDPGSVLPRSVTMSSQEITVAMVQNTQVINTPTGDVGYMTFNLHRSPAEQELIDAINALQGVDDLVLDLRYNRGGFLDIASQVAYMIAGGATAGRTFETTQFNDKYPATDPITGQPIEPVPFYDETLGFSVPAGQPLPTLNLSRVFVLTGSNTASASEAIMNGLRGIGFEVIQIGSTTRGKPYGGYAQENCGTTYSTIQFRGVNEANFGDYTDGFTPSAVDDGEANILGCQVADDLTQQLGNPAENRLEVALAYQAGEGCIAPVGAAPGDGAAKASINLNTSDGEIYRSFFDSNRILGRPRYENP